MSNELIKHTLNLEGQRFKLLLRYDATLSEYTRKQIKKEVDRLTMQIETFHKVIEEWRKNRRKIG